MLVYVSVCGYVCNLCIVLSVIYGFVLYMCLCVCLCASLWKQTVCWVYAWLNLVYVSCVVFIIGCMHVCGCVCMWTVYLCMYVYVARIACIVWACIVCL